MTSSQLPMKHPGGPGRPTFSDKVRAKALRGLRAGMTRKAAAGFAGIHRDTLYEWMKDDEFRKLVEQAEDAAEAAYTATIRTASSTGSWRAALAWLERRRPQSWRERITVDEGTVATEDVIDEAMQDDDLAARLVALADDAQRRRASRAGGASEDGASPEAGGDEPS